jgi:GNAT superfamily N-acetyltransferase
MIPGTGQMHRVYYALFVDTPKGPRPMSWLCLWQKTNWWAYAVEQLWTFPEFRGRGHAKALYKAAIDVDTIMIASGKLHTKYSKALWESFVRKKTFNIWAHDFKDLRRWCDVYWDDELCSRMPLYDGPGDIRLVALRKN